MTMNKHWTPICALDDILPWSGVAAKVNGEQLAVFRTGDDEVYALANHDPFSSANVMSRGIVGDLQGELVVASPIYKQHFRLRDGVCLEDDSVALKSWKVRLFDGSVMVNTASESQAA